MLEGFLVDEETDIGSVSRVITDVAIIAEGGAGPIPRLLISATSTLTFKSTSTTRASKSTEHHDLIGKVNPRILHMIYDLIVHVRLLVYDVENRRIERLVNLPICGIPKVFLND